ncbi:putative ribonuclease H-like domain-containing protein [Tanacetum coccineum]
MLVQVYVDDIIFGSTKKSMCTEFEDCMHKRFQMSSMGELTFFLGLQVKQLPDGIFISQDKYIADILKKFDFWSIRKATTPIEYNKPLVEDEDGESVDVHVYRSMIGSLMYLIASRPDIMFVVCAYARFQVTPKASHLNAVKRIFRYLKHQPKLGLWYPRDSPFELEAFSDSDYGGASLDRKSTTGGCQFLGRRLISWQCKKQTIVANSTTKAEYVAAANCCGQFQVVLRAPRQNGVYSLDLKNIVPSGGITCLYANATTNESKLWHMRLGHVNFKNINKLVKGHLVRGLPSKVFVNDHTCVACKKGKQHKASCKAKLERTIRKPLELLHMDLFGPVSVESINKKKYCLVVTDDFSRFSWVFFLATKDETNEILYKFITGLENQLNHKVKIIRSDHRTEFKNHAMNELCAKKGIKREFSVARTPQQNGVAERKNRTLIEAARTMLADSLLPIPFWAKAVNIACYILNMVLETKPQNKTPYELLIGKPPSISFIRPFGCPLTILNTLDPLGKFDGKSDEGYLLGYSTTSKAFRVYNKRTKRVEENMHIDFLEDQPNVAGSGPDWMFDLDFLTNTMNYIHVSVENQVNVDAGTQEHYVAGSSEKDKEPTQEYILLPLHPHRLRISVEDVVQAAQEKPSENSPKDNDAQDSEDVAEKEEQHMLTEPEPAKKMTRSDFDAAQIARDAEITRQLQVELQAEVKRERQMKEEASKAAIAESKVLG